MPEPAIVVSDLRKQYGGTIAVAGISFEVAPGEIFGLLGPNGAGKTSTLECLEGIRRADGGTLRILGVDPAREPRRLGRLIGVQLQTSGLPATMEVHEALDFFSAYHGVAPRPDLLARLGLADRPNAQYRELSTGQQRRLALALALAHRPPVVLLDEPTAGLDVAETLVPAMVVFACMTGTLLGLPNPLVDSREAGIFRSFKINGVPAASILATPALGAMVHALLVSVLIAVSGPALFGGRAPVDWGAFAGVAVATAAACAALGVLIGVIAANSQATVLWSQAIFLPSMLIGGLMLPLSQLPESVRPFAALLPTAHAMQAFVGLAYGGETVIDPRASLAALAASAVLSFALAVYLFNWDSRNNARRGHPALALLALLPFGLTLLLR